jgi:L-asparaginase II
MAVVDPPCGIAFKVDDGCSRARNAIACDLLGQAGAWAEPPAGLAGDIRPKLRNVRGTVVGEILVDVPLDRFRTEGDARVAGGAPAAAAPRR